MADAILPITRAISETPAALLTTAPATSTAPLASTSSSTPLSYSSISNGSNTGGLSWSRLLAPVTGDAVFTAQKNGQTLYVGPDNQLYSGSASSFSRSGSQISPIIRGAGAAVATTWASLFGGPTSSTIYESTYTGPGAESQAHNDAAYSALATQTGEGLFLSPTSMLGAGAASSSSQLALPAPSTGTAAVQVVGNSTTAATSGTDSSSTGSALSLSSALTDALASALSGGDGSGLASTDDAVGVPSTAGIVSGDTAALDALQPAAADASSSSSSNPALLLAIVGAIAIGGYLLWERAHHKAHPAIGGGGGSPAPSTPATAPIAEPAAS